MIGDDETPSQKRVVGFAWTAGFATAKIRALAAKPGMIALTDSVRRHVIRYGPTHPQLGRFLREGIVREKPTAAEDGAYECIVVGSVPDAARGARVEVTVWKDRLYVTSVEWN